MTKLIYKSPGRPKLSISEKRVSVTVRLPYDLVAWMFLQDRTRTELIEVALLAYYADK